MNDCYMKKAQMKYRGTIFFDTSRGDRPSLPLPPLACKYDGSPPATAEAGLKSLPWFFFPWNTQVPIGVFFKAKSCYFIATWAKKLADKPF